MCVFIPPPVVCQTPTYTAAPQCLLLDRRYDPAASLTYAAKRQNTWIKPFVSPHRCKTRQPQPHRPSLGSRTTRTAVFLEEPWQAKVKPQKEQTYEPGLSKTTRSPSTQQYDPERPAGSLCIAMTTDSKKPYYCQWGKQIMWAMRLIHQIHS